MKNLIVKISSLFVLAIILTVVSVQAQSLRHYRAQIPFDFKIGSKAYKAGDYIIKVENQLSMARVLMFKNAKTHNLRQLFVLPSGSRSLVDKTILMFDRYGEEYVLTEMVSPDFALSIPKTKTKKHFVKNPGQPDQTLAIVLTKVDKEIE